MPIKPTDLPLPWATDVNYTTGPFPGDPTKDPPPLAVAAEGHRPGAAFPTTAEHQNWQQYANTAFTLEWVNLGTFNPDADAHIVETDINGIIRAQRAQFANTVDPLSPSLEVATSGATTAAIELTTADPTSIGIRHDTTQAGIAAFLQADNPLPAVVALNLDGIGIQASSGANHGLYAPANAAFEAALFEGFLGIAGARSDSANDPAGLGHLARALHPDATALRAESDPGATTTGTAVEAEAFVDGVAVRAVAEDGYAAVLSTQGTSATLRHVPLASDPATAADGDVYFNSTEGQEKTRRSAFWMGQWSTIGGEAHGFETNNTVGLIGTIFATVATAQMNAPFEPKLNGRTVLLSFGFVPDTDPTTPSYEVQVVRNPGAVVVYGPQEFLNLKPGGLGPPNANAWSAAASDTPSAGVTTYELQVRRTAGGTNMTAVEAYCIALGSF